MIAGANGSPVYDFTSLDFAGIKADLEQYAQSTFPSELWTDFNDSNFGTFLLELMSYATDLLSYNCNSQVLETVVVTLIREQNFRNIGKAFDYTLKSAQPSTSIERCTLDPAGTYPFTISSHLQFATADGIVFQPVADVGVAAYVATVDVPVVQGVESFEEVIGTTSNQPGQTFTLKSPFMIDGTLSVDVGLVPYSLVSNAVVSSPTDKSFTIATDENGVTTVTMGDGINGAIPPSGQDIIATYKTGGGLNTNLPATAIKAIVGTSDGSAIPPQILSVSNVVAATQGGPKQSLASAKQNLPLSLKANVRCVTLQDYSTETVRLIGGVFKASAVAGVPFGGSTPVLLFVVPNGGGDPTDVLRNQIIVGLKDEKLAGKRIRVFAAVYVELFIEVDVFVQSNAPSLLVANRVRATLDSKYALTSPDVDFGVELGLQDAYDTVGPTAVGGVGRVFFRTFTVLPYFARHVNKPTTGNGDVEGIQTNLDTVKRREWLVHVTPPAGSVLVNQFTVTQRQLGSVTSVTDSLLTDESANYTPADLVSWFLRPNPDVNSISYPIVGNTTQTITVASGLLVTTEPADSYVVERQETMVGKVLRTTMTGPMVAGFSIPVASSASFTPGDNVRISATGVDISTIVVAKPDGFTLTMADHVTAPSGAVVDFLWVSDDGSVKFSVVDAAGMAVPPTPANAFVVGDELYVDTYPRTGDLVLRAENFPELMDSNLVINTIGGVK